MPAGSVSGHCWVGVGSPGSTSHPWRTPGCREEEFIPSPVPLLCPCSPPSLLGCTELLSLGNPGPVFSGELGGRAFKECCVPAKLLCQPQIPAGMCVS